MDKVLLVEDDRLFRELFINMLQEAGLVADAVSTSEEALGLLVQQPYSLAILNDQCSGLLNSQELLLRIKASDLSCDVILLTTLDDPAPAVAALRLGARHCLPKSANPAVLLHAVQLCLEQRRLVQENSELLTMVTLFETSQSLTGCLDPGTACQLLVAALTRETATSRALCFIKDGDLISCLAVKGMDASIVPLINEQLVPLLSQQVKHHNRPFRWLLPHHGQLPEVLDLREALLIPLVAHTTLLGCVVLFNDAEQLLPSALNDRNVAFYQEQGARALENALKFTATRDMLYVDELSGLFNYRYLKIALEREIKRSDRYATQLTVMFLDLDNFKGVNDTHGHMVGSGVLRELGGLLKKTLREVDVVIRYGGDEYTIILVETGPSIAQRVGERIRKQIESHPFMQSDGYHIQITASIGFACYPDDTNGMQELLSMADQAMYVGKASGKNCVFRVASPLAGAGR